MTDPNRVLLMGDTRGNSDWTRYVIGLVPELLSYEPEPLILHTGDFGVWPHGEDFLDTIEEKLAEVRAQLLFVDGNHEWHPYLRELARKNSTGKPGMIRVRPCIQWLERGYRWTWHDKTWLALGGAVSVDASTRTKGESWWPEEALTFEDIQRAIEGGPADVMLTHDAPTEVKMIFRTPPHFWEPLDLAKAEKHRELLQRVVNAVNPELLIHGHYHQAVRQQFVESGRRIMGLDMDGTEENYTLLDTRTLEEIIPWTTQ